MGFFSKLFKGTKQLNRLAVIVGKVKIYLDNLENDSYAEFEAYIHVAWICRVGILDIIEQESMGMNYKLFVNVNGHLTGMTVAEALAMSVGRLSAKVARFSSSEQEIIQSILDKGEWFNKVDRLIPDDARAIIDG